MATSGSTDFALQRDELIKASLRMIGVLRKGQTPPSDEIQDASEALNLIIKQLMSPSNIFNRSFKAFALDRNSLTLSAKLEYSIKPSGGDLALAIPVGVVSVVRRDTSNKDVPLKEMTLGEFRALPDKTTTGSPTKYHYEKGVTQGTLYLNRIPSDTTDTLQLLTRRVLEDVDAAGDDLDFPVEWQRLIKALLGTDLAPEYGVSVPADVKAIITMAKAEVESIDEELVEAWFEPGRDD